MPRTAATPYRAVLIRGWRAGDGWRFHLEGLDDQAWSCGSLREVQARLAQVFDAARSTGQGQAGVADQGTVEQP